MKFFKLITSLLSVTRSATRNDPEPSHGRVPAGEVNIETGPGLGPADIAAPVVLAPSLGSSDQPEHDLELDVIIEHAELDYELVIKLAQINRRIYKHFRGRAHDEWLRGLTERRSSDGDFFQTCRQMFPRPAHVLSDIFTDETAPLFLSRLQMAARYSPDAVTDLFKNSGIGRIQSVAKLIPGWVVSIIVQDTFLWSNYSARHAVGNIVQLVRDGVVVTPSASIPDDIRNAMQQHINNTQDNTILSHLPGRFEGISFFNRSLLAECVSNLITPQLIQSHPDLIKNLFFLGVPVFLTKFLVSIPILDLQRILPFAIEAPHALVTEIADLIKEEHFDVISAIINCESFRFAKKWMIHRIILELIGSESPHGLLRDLLQTPFRDGLLHAVASIGYPPILHEAVRVGNAAAVRELLSIEGLFEVNLLDDSRRTARSYAVDGSEIALLLDG